MEATIDLARHTAPWLKRPLLEEERDLPVVLGDIVAMGEGAFGTVPSGIWSFASYGLCLESLGGTVRGFPPGLEAVVDLFGTTGRRIQIRWPVGNPVQRRGRVHKEGPSVTSEAASFAREVRDASGLSARKLAGLFPVERESFQRWLSGEQVPSAANLERLLSLRHFLRALKQRVDDPKSWLLAPMRPGEVSPSAYEVLRSGNLTDLWAAISALPSNAPRRTYLAEEGGYATIVEGSLRGRDYRATEEELDDYAELFDDEE